MKFVVKLLIFLLFISLLLMMKSSDENLFILFKGTILETLLSQFSFANTIIFNLSIGFIVSIVFYFLVVWIPDMKKKKLLKNNLTKHYLYFKENSLHIFCHAMNEECDTSLMSKLMLQNEFKIFFKTKISDSQERWDSVLNGLDNQLLYELLGELELLKNEIEFINNNITIDDEDVFVFMKNLSINIYRLRDINLENNDIKVLSRFLWQLFSGWSCIDGYKKDDIVQVMISKI